MPQDDKAPIATEIPTNDPADAFKRVAVETPPPMAKSKGSKKKPGDRPREPVITIDAKDAIIIDEDEMSPLDAAEEIVGMMDNLFSIAASIRGYDKVVIDLGNGQHQSMLAMVTPDDKKRARLQKALARVMKGNGMSMSPSAALGLAVFGCYVAPIGAMEYAIYAGKKKQ